MKLFLESSRYFDDLYASRFISRPKGCDLSRLQRGKNHVMQLEPGFDGSVARKHIGLAYDEYGFETTFEYALAIIITEIIRAT